MNMDRASCGFLTIEQFAPGKDLWLLASGTGLGLFLAILRGQLTARGFHVNRRAAPGQLAFENYWQAAPS